MVNYISTVNEPFFDIIYARERGREGGRGRGRERERLTCNRLSNNRGMMMRMIARIEVVVV